MENEYIRTLKQEGFRDVTIPHEKKLELTWHGITMSKHHTEISKFLSFVLRHKPEAIGLTLDAEGWAEIDLLIACANQSGQALTRPLLQEVVETSDKKRFTVSEDGLRIRAAQGHSAQSVAIAHVEKQPPEFLYHGTAMRFLDSIREKGLLPLSRHHVHLSEDEQTATAVGQRYGKPIVLKIKALLMAEQGFKFYQADNGVWLTESVPIAYFQDNQTHTLSITGSSSQDSARNSKQPTLSK